VTVQRTDIAGPVVELLSYDGVSVKGSLDKKTVATLEPAGVGVINAALDVFTNPDSLSVSPVLEFVTSNESVTPPPSSGDAIIFDWTLWIRYQVVAPAVFETFDPLP
jgi:hypothetical protein